jgi:hypothetical protein
METSGSTNTTPTTGNPQNIPKQNIEPQSMNALQGLGASGSGDTVPIGQTPSLSTVKLNTIQPTSSIPPPPKPRSNHFPLIGGIIFIIVLAIAAYSYARYKVWI